MNSNAHINSKDFIPDCPGAFDLYLQGNNLRSNSEQS